MTGEDGVGAAAANGQGTANEMPHAPVQGFLLRAVVDGEGYPQLGDMNIAHSPGSGKV